MKKRIISLLFSLLLVLAGTDPCFAGKTAPHWVGTWGTAPQLVEPNNMPPAPGLAGNTLRQAVRVSIGGNVLRLKLSNVFGKDTVTLRSVRIARSTGGSTIDKASEKELTFGGKPEVMLEPGTGVVSDALRFKLRERMDLTITISIERTSPTLTGHPGSRTTSYLLTSNDPAATDFSQAVPADHWYLIQGIDVKVPGNRSSVVILGNSITDGRGSETNRQNRWPDVLSERLLKNRSTRNVGVLNMGIGGNCILWGGLGQTALKRFDRDVLGQEGLRWVVIFIGVNDIGGMRPDTPEAVEKKTQQLIEAYGQMIDKAHARGLKVYGGTIMPFKGNGYYTPNREACRNQVNQWIRTSGRFDAVIDFDRIMDDPANPGSLPADLDFQNDFLHPNAEGYRLMGNSIDLKLFE